MRIIAFIFFLILGCCLPGKSLHAQAFSQPGLNSTTGFQKSRQAKKAEATPFHTVCVDSGVTEETPSLIDVDDEDEEMFTRKQVLLTKYILFLSHAFISDDSDDVRADLFPLPVHVSAIGSPKYIEQRSLLI